MLIACMERDGRKVLVLGLEDENIKLLLNDKPIYKNMREQDIAGLEDWDVSILGPEDTVRFVAHFKRDS